MRFSTGQIDSILPFLEVFEAKEFQFGKWNLPRTEDGSWSYPSIATSSYPSRRGSSSKPSTRTAGFLGLTGRRGKMKRSSMSNRPSGSHLPTWIRFGSSSRRMFVRITSAQGIWQPCSRMGTSQPCSIESGNCDQRCWKRKPRDTKKLLIAGENGFGVGRNQGKSKPRSRGVGIRFHGRRGENPPPILIRTRRRLYFPTRNRYAERGGSARLAFGAVYHLASGRVVDNSDFDCTYGRVQVAPLRTFWSHVLTAFSFRVHLSPARTDTGQPGPAFPIRNSRPSAPVRNVRRSRSG